MLFFNDEVIPLLAKVASLLVLVSDLPYAAVRKSVHFPTEIGRAYEVRVIDANMAWARLFYTIQAHQETGESHKASRRA